MTNMNPPDIKTTAKLFKTRALLDKIGQASWSFSVLNKQHPIQSLTQETAEDLILAYQDIIDNIRNFLNTEHEQSQKTP